MRVLKEKKIQKIKKKHEKKLLAFPNVVEVGIGEKVRAGIRTGRTSVKIYVEKKIPIAGLEAVTFLNPISTVLETFKVSLI